MAVTKLTKKKYDELTAELLRRKTEERDKISKDIQHAKEFGDLSENAEYSAAKDAYDRNETEIARLEGLLSNIEIIDETTVNTDVVGELTVVKVYDRTFDEEIVFSIVPSLEVDVFNNKISITSPIGKALHGHKAGEVVKAKTPGGEVVLEIREISK